MNTKNDNLMGSLNNQTNSDLNRMDDTLFASGNKSYRDASNKSHKHGGLEHTG